MKSGLADLHRPRRRLAFAFFAVALAAVGGRAGAAGMAYVTAICFVVILVTLRLIFKHRWFEPDEGSVGQPDK